MGEYGLWIDTGTDRDVQFGNTLIDYTKGSLSSERRQPRSKTREHLYNFDVKKCRNQYRGSFTFEKMIYDPNNFNIQLSLMEEQYPNLSFILDVNIQKITNSDVRELRAFLFWYIFSENITWQRFFIDESLSKYLNPLNLLNIGVSTKESKTVIENPKQRFIELKSSIKRNGEIISEKIHKKPLFQKIEKIEHRDPYIRYRDKGKRFLECLTLFQQYLVLGAEATQKLIEVVYSKNNIEKYIQRGRRLISKQTVVSIPYYRVREKIYKRGYRKSSTSDPRISKNQEARVMKSNESIELEKALQRIKLKQALLFEQRLDAYLELSNCEELSNEDRKRIFSSLLSPITNETESEELPTDLESTLERKEPNEELCKTQHSSISGKDFKPKPIPRGSLWKNREPEERS